MPTEKSLNDNSFDQQSTTVIETAAAAYAGMQTIQSYNQLDSVIDAFKALDTLFNDPQSMSQEQTERAFDVMKNAEHYLDRLRQGVWGFNGGYVGLYLAFTKVLTLNKLYQEQLVLTGLAIEAKRAALQQYSEQLKAQVEQALRQYQPIIQQLSHHGRFSQQNQNLLLIDMIIAGLALGATTVATGGITGIPYSRTYASLLDSGTFTSPSAGIVAGAGFAGATVHAGYGFLSGLFNKFTSTIPLAVIKKLNPAQLQSLAKQLGLTWSRKLPRPLLMMRVWHASGDSLAAYKTWTAYEAQNAAVETKASMASNSLLIHVEGDKTQYLVERKSNVYGNSLSVPLGVTAAVLLATGVLFPISLLLAATIGYMTHKVIKAISRRLTASYVGVDSSDTVNEQLSSSSAGEVTLSDEISANKAAQQNLIYLQHLLRRPPIYLSFTKFFSGEFNPSIPQTMASYKEDLNFALSDKKRHRWNFLPVVGWYINSFLDAIDSAVFHSGKSGDTRSFAQKIKVALTFWQPLQQVKNYGLELRDTLVAMLLSIFAYFKATFYDGAIKVSDEYRYSQGFINTATNVAKAVVIEMFLRPVAMLINDLLIRPISILLKPVIALLNVLNPFRALRPFRVSRRLAVLKQQCLLDVEATSAAVKQKVITELAENCSSRNKAKGDEVVAVQSEVQASHTSKPALSLFQFKRNEVEQIADVPRRQSPRSRARSAYKA